MIPQNLTIFTKQNLKLRGYFNYYGVYGNSVSLKVFYDKALFILFKWLNRRSQRLSFNEITGGTQFFSINR